MLRWVRETASCLTAIGVLVASNPTQATAQGQTKEYTATSICILNNSGTMLYNKDYWVTFVSGVVGKEGIPTVINAGDPITVKNTTIRANRIRVTRYLKDMIWKGEVLTRKGQTTCVIAQTEKDLPGDEERNRVWIYVEECQPLIGTLGASAAAAQGGGTVGPLISLKPQESLELSDGVRAMYVGGVIDGMTFMSYGYSLPDHVEFAQCVQSMTVGALSDKVLAWLKQHPDFTEGTATAVAMTMGAACPR